MGLRGEAGAEAILPLQRGRNGKLGVQASGGTGNIVVNVAALAVGGRTPPATNVTDEFTASAAVSTVTTS